MPALAECEVIMSAVISCITIKEDFNPQRSQSQRISEALDLIDQAACDKPDLICLPEAFAQHHIPAEKWSEIRETLDGEIVARVSEKAKDYSCYIICPALIHDGDSLTNAAILIDRQGKYVGRYEKNMPTIIETQVGVKAGSEASVFETDFGKLGMAICFDLNFREIGKALCDEGAQIILFPSMYDGGLQLRAWALEFQCFVASAVLGGTNVIIDPIGRVLHSSSLHEPVITHQINLDYKICHIDSIKDKVKEIKTKYGSSISISYATPEARCKIKSNDPLLKMDDILHEFDIETFREYCTRSLNLRKQKAKQSGTNHG